MKYRKKPVVVEAVRWDGKNHREMWDFLTGKTNEPMSAYGENFYIDHSKVTGGLVIKTLEGEHIASVGDYIIKGVNGEFYPCKPDIFEKTYDKWCVGDIEVPLPPYVSEIGVLAQKAHDALSNLQAVLKNLKR